MRFHKSYLLLETFFWLTGNFLLRRVTRVLWGVSHMTQHRLYGQCSLVNICLCSSFETSRQFLRGSFSKGKRNDIRQGLASSHVNSQWLVNPRRIAPEKTQWKWTRGMWQDSCDARFLWKRPGMWKRSDASHINLQSHWTQDVFYLKKHSESGRVPATHVLVEKRYGIRERWVARQMNLQSEGTQDAFYLKKNTRNLGGLVERAFFTEKHRSRWGWVILGKKIYSQDEDQAQFTWENTRISPRSAGRARTCHVNLQSKWRPGAFYTRKHNDFSAVGAHLRRGCILIRNRDQVSSYRA